MSSLRVIESKAGERGKEAIGKIIKSGVVREEEEALYFAELGRAGVCFPGFDLLAGAQEEGASRREKIPKEIRLQPGKRRRPGGLQIGST